MGNTHQTRQHNVAPPVPHLTTVGEETKEHEDATKEHEDGTKEPNILRVDNVNALVDQMMHNNKINSPFVLDALERRMYTRLVTLLLENIEELCKTIELRVINKKIQIVVSTIVDEDKDDKEAAHDDENTAVGGETS
jgi:hypothetical protein